MVRYLRPSVAYALFTHLVNARAWLLRYMHRMNNEVTSVSIITSRIKLAFTNNLTLYTLEDNFQDEIVHTKNELLSS
jgi:hypothetical protein